MIENYSAKKIDFRKCYQMTQQRHAMMGKRVSITAMVNETINGKAPGYYITFDYARRLLSLYRRGRLPKGLSRLRCELIAELNQRVEQLNLGTNSHAVGDALSKVLAKGNASRFFITTATARRFLYS